MVCDNCGEPIPAARQEALPGETWCRSCVESTGDVERIKGVMLWDHKTAPRCYIGPGVEKILAEQRRGPHAQMAFTHKENIFVQKSLETFNLSEGMNLLERPDSREEKEVVNQIPSRCHPDRPRVSPDGKCLLCALDYYARRVRRK